MAPPILNTMKQEEVSELFCRCRWLLRPVRDRMRNRNQGFPLLL